MSNALSIAVNGINATVSRATQSASNIANASLTGKNIDSDLINLRASVTNVAANADVIKTEEKNQKALLDIQV